MLRVGLVGCGHIGCAVHLNSLRRLPAVEVVALAEPDSERLEAARRLVPRATIFADYHELIDLPDVDAVVVCLPNALHAEAGLAALRRKKHLYLEKPLALNLNEGQRLLEEWRHSGKVAMVGFNYRFNPLHREIRRHLAAGLIGELVGARSVWTTAANRAPAWKQTRVTGGGALLDLASHHIDLVRFFFNREILEVRASISSKRAESDTASLNLHLSGDIHVQSFFSTNSIDDDRFGIYGREGTLKFDRFKSWKVEIDVGRRTSIARQYFDKALSFIPRNRFAINKVIAPAREPSFATAMAHFISAAQKGEQTNPNFEDGFQSLAVVIAAEDSARTGNSTPVSPLPG